MNMVKKILTNLLLIFVIFSLGFAIGKEVAISKYAGTQAPVIDKDETIIVYYLRSTFRCWQCNMIEVYAEELINAEFSEYLETGALKWQVYDFLHNRELADRYNISGNTVIVARFRDGEEVGHQRLDAVMEKVLNQDSFMVYVREAILKYLQDVNV